MFFTKKSHIIIVLLFLSAGLCFGQTPSENKDEKNNSADNKPQTIHLKPGRQIKHLVASDNEAELYIVDSEGSVYSFDLKTYQQNWSADLGGTTTSNIIEYEDRISVVTTISINVADELTEQSILWEIDKLSGLTINKTKAEGKSPFYLFSTRKFILSVSSNSCVTLFDTELHKIIGESCENIRLDYRPVFGKDGSELYLIYKDRILKLSIGGQLKAEKIAGKTKTISSVAYSDGMFLIGDDAGNLYAFSKLSNEKNWRFRTGGKISGIRILEDKVLVSSYDNFVYCLNKIDGDIIWKRRFPGRVAELVIINENNLAVRSTYTNDFYLIDSNTGNIDDIYLLPENTSGEISLTTTMRLIMIQHSNSIDIYKYKKN